MTTTTASTDTDPDLIEISNANGVIVSRDQDDDSLVVSIEKDTAEADYPVIPEGYVLTDAETDRDGTLFQNYEVRPAVRRILKQAREDRASRAYWLGMISGLASEHLNDPGNVFVRSSLADALAAEAIANRVGA